MKSTFWTNGCWMTLISEYWLVVWCMVHKGFCNRTLSLLLGYLGLFSVRVFDDLMFV